MINILNQYTKKYNLFKIVSNPIDRNKLRTNNYDFQDANLQFIKIMNIAL